jgi:hypothetical protein
LPGEAPADGFSEPDHVRIDSAADADAHEGLEALDMTAESLGDALSPEAQRGPAADTLAPRLALHGHRAAVGQGNEVHVARIGEGEQALDEALGLPTFAVRYIGGTDLQRINLHLAARSSSKNQRAVILSPSACYSGRAIERNRPSASA